MRLLLLIIFFSAILSYGQSKQYLIEFIAENTYNNIPVVDSILINEDLKTYISIELPEVFGKMIRIRTVLLDCGGEKYFRVYDCVLQSENNILSYDLVKLSDWLSDKIILIYFNPNVDPAYLEQPVLKYDFFLAFK